jgi:hypothetical protein
MEILPKKNRLAVSRGTGMTAGVEIEPRTTVALRSAMPFGMDVCFAFH